MYGQNSIVARVRSHAHTAGDSVALVHDGRSISYGEVDRLVGERVETLDAAGAAGALVAIERTRSADFVLDYLAVLATGGTVLPLDPDTPPARRQTFLDLARPEFLWQGGEPVRLGPPAWPDKPADGAFVYFTSGSTGVPKPVLGSGAALLSFVDWFGPEFEIGPGDRFAFTTGVSFEASLRDLFPPLYRGATLVIPTTTPSAVVPWLTSRGITILTVVPSVARTWLAEATSPCPSVRAVFFIGEPPAPDVLAAWSGTFPNTRVRVNSYGSTESGQATVFRRVPPDVSLTDRVPAGRPVPGTRFCFVDPEAPALVPALDAPKESGEIVLISKACSHGYLGLTEHTTERFATLADGARAYRTGDLGRVDAAGELVVVGRADDEVKVNGVRVHPAEVTRAIRAHASVADVFVAAGEARLVGYVVPGAPDFSVPRLRQDLMDVLPLAMIPALFVELAELPRTRTGKVDRAALTRLASAPVEAPYVAPRGDVECWVADQFRELFGLDLVGARDDFFALGGDSITATRLATRAQRDLDVDLSQRDVFAAATVADLAEAIVERRLLAADPDELLALLDTLERDSR